MEYLWEDEIRAFEEGDRGNPPAKGLTVLVGSSILRMWDGRKYFPDIPHYNRCFGGARTWELNRYYPRLVPRLAPSRVVYYCGSNDLCADRNAAQVLEGFRTFLGMFRLDFPETELLYLSILRSPSKKNLFGEIHAINRAVEEQSRRESHMIFLDLNPALSLGGPDPDPSFFVEVGRNLGASVEILPIGSLNPYVGYRFNALFRK